MNSHEHSRTGIAVLDQFGDSFNLLLREIDEREKGANVVALPTRAPRRRAAFAFAAAAAVVIAVAVFAYSLIAGGNLATDQAIADVARSASVQTLPPDDAYTYTRARIVETQMALDSPGQSGKPPANPKSFLVTSERQSWMSIARAGLVQTNRLEAVFAGSFKALPDLGRADSTFKYPAAGAYRIGDKTYTREEIENFPTDPQAIYDRLDAEVETGNPADRTLAMWHALTDPLAGTSPPLPPELRAGLVQAIGLLPGVETQGTVKTPRAQEGTGFELVTNGVRENIIFDADTSAVLYDVERVSDARTAELRGVRANAILSSYELLDQKVTESLPPTTR